MSTETRDDKSMLLNSDGQPAAVEERIDFHPPVVNAINADLETAPEELGLSGADRIVAANQEDLPGAQRCREESGKQQVVLVAILMAMLVTVTVAFHQSLSPYMIQHDNRSVTQCTLICYMIAGLLVIFSLLFFFSRITLQVRQTSEIGTTRTQKVNKILSNYLSIVGMSFFFPFACALDVCHIVAGTTCDKQYRMLAKLCTDEIYKEYWIDVFYHLTRILFMGAELLFCLQFHKTRFTTHPVARLGLMLIMVVNLALWFDSLIHETADRESMSDVRSLEFDTLCVNESYYEPKSLELCHNQTTGIYKICSDVTSFLYPFTIEFCLLAGEFLAHKFFSCKDGKNEGQRLIESNEHQQAQMGGGNGAENASESQVRPSATHLPGSVLIVAVGLGANIVLVILAFYAHFSESRSRSDEEEDLPNPVTFFRTCSVVYYNLMLFVVALGFACGSRFELRKKSIRGIDYLVLMSAFGPLMYCQIYVTAISRNVDGIKDSEYGKPAMLVADFVANLVQLSFQTVFVFFADRVKPLTTEQRQEILLRHLHGAFKAVVFVLAICNLTNWIIDSILFANFTFKQDFLQKIFKRESYVLVNGIFVPLTIFCRFNSFLLFTRAYLNGKA